MARALMILGLLLCPVATLAQETVAPDKASVERAAVEKAMAKDPDRFSGLVVDLIAGFGGGGGLTPAGIEEHIALERAAGRATALRRFAALDLDADGAVGGDELAIAQRAANAQGRGRLARQFADADADADGRLDADELADQGRAAGLRALGEDEASLLRGLMTLDADADGALTAVEVDRAVAGLEKGD